MAENEQSSNGTFSLTVLESMSEHVLDHDSLTAGGANTSEIRSISEVLEARTRLHTELPQPLYYDDRQHYHSWNHGTH